MRLKKIINIILVSAIICSMLLFPTQADTSKNISISAPAKLTDGKISTNTAISSAIEITGEKAKFIYIIFWDEPCDFTLSNGIASQEFEGKFLHRLIEIPEALVGNNITINFKNTVKISEVSAYDSPPPESEVQYWEDNDSLCDLLLFSTHADDEQLFFAGTLPLYAADGVTEVQVVYFTDHNNNIARRHELLNGLWTVGVKRYPVISEFPDAYSESYEGALKNLKNAGFSEDDALAFQVEQIRKFKPLVILGHDLNGEYGHGQHILNSTLLTKAVDSAADSTQFSKSFNLYGAYDTPKIYLHLYDKNKIELDLDSPKEYLGGKTPFEISKQGFACHVSQQGTWFKTWLNGKSGQITKASQINSYSPCKFGLFRSTVGEDVLKNDLFENVTRRTLIPTPEPEPEPQPQPEPQPSDNAEKSNSGIRTYLIITICIASVVICFFAVRKKQK